MSDPTMTAKEAIVELCRRGAHDPTACFLYLANHVAEFRLSDGQRLNDGTDFIAWLRELAEASEDQDSKDAFAAARAKNPDQWDGLT